MKIPKFLGLRDYVSNEVQSLGALLGIQFCRHLINASKVEIERDPCKRQTVIRCSCGRPYYATDQAMEDLQE